ncbi:hypothetical protein DBV15_04043 [Temnothorax longispinosus]|uniref:Uncharacterized protein n=1 Tax=Temnothorax longispinosus TaxID=300112 RepID=A0A4S2KFS1_9HYME|nr:hypothetical protein DBV15_04043 [Temnothorax longispinosus]
MFAAMVLHKHNKHNNGNHSNHHASNNNSTTNSTSNHLNNNNHINNNVNNVNQAYSTRAIPTVIFNEKVETCLSFTKKEFKSHRLTAYPFEAQR